VPEVGSWRSYQVLADLLGSIVCPLSQKPQRITRRLVPKRTRNVTRAARPTCRPCVDDSHLLV
ncbi:hypothetical protein J6590_106962, partial [Homalodisca vitripennis]